MVTRTKFLSPLGVQAVVNEVALLSEVSAVAFGGYPHAERCRVLIMRDELLETHKDDLQNIAEIVPVQVTSAIPFTLQTMTRFLGIGEFPSGEGGSFRFSRCHQWHWIEK